MAFQTPLSMGLSRQEYWSEWPFPSQEDLPNPGIKPRTSALQGDSLLLSHQGRRIDLTKYWGNLWFHKRLVLFNSVQFSSVAQLCPTLCNPMNCSMPGLPVHHQLLESTQTYVHRVDDAIQPSHPLSSPSLPTFNLSQHQGLFQGVGSSHQVAKVLEFQLQHQSFQ